MGITRARKRRTQQARRITGVRRRIVMIKRERERLAPYPEMFAARLQHIDAELVRLDRLVNELTTKEVA
jgi:hypothetical protein